MKQLLTILMILCTWAVLAQEPEILNGILNYNNIDPKHGER